MTIFFNTRAFHQLKMTNHPLIVIVTVMLNEDVRLDLPRDVELLCLTMGAPLLLQGKLSELDHDDNHLLFTSREGIPIRLDNHRAIVNCKDDNIPMFTLNIEKQNEGLLYLEYSFTHPREKRLFPRLYGQIPLLIHEVEREFVVAKWLNGDIDPDSSWLKPEPFMNFSINGVSFQSNTPLSRMSTVLVYLDEGSGSRIVARVIRCAKEGERYDIALYFEEVPEEVLIWFSEKTLRIQDALL